MMFGVDYKLYVLGVKFHIASCKEVTFNAKLNNQVWWNYYRCIHKPCVYTETPGNQKVFIDVLSLKKYRLKYALQILFWLSEGIKLKLLNLYIYINSTCSINRILNVTLYIKLKIKGRLHGIKILGFILLHLNYLFKTP